MKTTLKKPKNLVNVKSRFDCLKFVNDGQNMHFIVI